MIVLLGLTIVISSLALADDKGSVKKEGAALQGEWAMVSGTANGMPIPEQMVKNMKRVCKGGEVTVTMGEQIFMKAKVKLDPSAKPKTVDFEVTDGPNKGKKLLGIYEVEGDTFKSCFAAPDAERPKDFTSKEGDMLTSTVWKRVKTEAKADEK